jgi:3',5'-cyclic AMP phosphodiesterase CpdA
LSEFLDEDEPLSIISKDSILLSELWRIRDENNEVALKGEKSFYAVAKQILNSTYSPETALKALIETESVSLINDGSKMIILQKDLITHKLIKEFTMYTGKKLKKFVDTALYNYNPSNGDKLFDMTYRTSKTPPVKLKNTHKQIKKLMNETVFPQIKKIIDDNETDVVIGTYSDYSFNMFESHSDT